MKTLQVVREVTVAGNRHVVKLSSVGNPDYGQYAPISNPETFIGDCLADCAAACRAYIEKWNLGGGNWTEPEITRGGVVLGHVSYNGRVWAGRRPKDWSATAPLLFCPSGLHLVPECDRKAVEKAGWKHEDGTSGAVKDYFAAKGGAR